jgi:hypothetical protein
MESIGKMIGVKGNDLSPWYKVDLKTFRKFARGEKLLPYYKTSMYRLLKAIYPDYEWIPWKFKVMPTVTSSDRVMVQKALKYIETECKLTKSEDWYDISVSKLKELRIWGLIKKLGGLYETLSEFRSEFKWEEEKFAAVRHYPERALKACLKRIFKGSKVSEEFELKSDKLMISFFVEKLKIGFDFQTADEYELENGSGSIEVRMIPNVDKKLSAEKEGIDLVFVPFWWNRDCGSLVATIISECPRMGTVIDSQSFIKESQPIPKRAVINRSSWKTRFIK